MRYGSHRILVVLAAGAWLLQSAGTLTQSPRAIEVARARASRHLDDLMARHGRPGEVSRRHLRERIDELGMSHHAVQQLHRGVPVFGGEAIAHLNADGSLASVTDAFLDGLDLVDVTPAISGSAAIARALAAYGEPAATLTATPVADLWVMQHNGDRLVYRVRLRREDGSPRTALPVYFIDAHDGSIVFDYDNLQTATGTGASLYSGTVPLDTYDAGAKFYLEDTTRKIGTFTGRNTITTLFRFPDEDNDWVDDSQRAGVDAHYGAAQVFDYFRSVHDCIGLDGNGGPASNMSADGVTGLITSRVHYGTNYSNAFWNGQVATFGDGDGTEFTPLVSLDIVGHELTHGVIESSANFMFYGESGSLSESFADVFGAMVERFARGGLVNDNTWKVAEDAYTPGTPGDALRYIDNPHAAENSGFAFDDHPDHYGERYVGPDDNGGVHFNAGIGNKAFYLVAIGGVHHTGGQAAGIGVDAAERIWYRALTTYMTSTTDYAGARAATINAVNDLFGPTSNQAVSVALAWCAVGVSECDPAPVGYPFPQPILDGGFETVPSLWSFSPDGHAFVVADGRAHSGERHAVINGSPAVVSYVHQTVAIPLSATGLTLWAAGKVLGEEWLDIAVGGYHSYCRFGFEGLAPSYHKCSADVSRSLGKTVVVEVRASELSHSATFLVDDVSLTFDHPPGGTMTNTTLAASPALPLSKEPLTLTATVAGDCDLDGTINFRDNTELLSAAVPTVNGVATWTIPHAAPGAHEVDAVFKPSGESCLMSGVSNVFIVHKRQQQIDFPPLQDQTYGGAPVKLQASASSPYHVEFEVVSGPAQAVGVPYTDTLIITGAGTVVVRALETGDDYYEPAPPVDRSFTVLKAPLSMAANNAQRGYWDPNPVFTATLTGLVGSDTIGATFSTTATATSPPGTYPIVATPIPGGKLPNYDVTTMPGMLTIVNPIATIASLGQTSIAVGGGDLPLDVNGQDFVPQTIVNWNGAPLATTFVSRTLVRADVPAAKRSTVGVGYLTAFQPAPGGGTSNLAEFFVTGTGAPVSDADTATLSGGSTQAETATVGGSGAGTPGSTSAIATGQGAVTVAQFNGNPGPSSIFESSGTFFDVFVPPSSALTTLTILSCQQSAANLVLWFNGTTWLPASNQTYDPIKGCVTIVVSADTSPSFADLTGTYFVASTDLTPPMTSASASPQSLWPANGKSVEVTIAGRLSDLTGIASARYIVADEYHEVALSGTVDVAADGSYRFTVMLPAARRGDDTDGRRFSVRVEAIDGAGNVGASDAVIIVPHSQGS